MLLTVVYKDGTEKSFKNITDVDTSVYYDDETKKPVYEIRFRILGHLSAVNLHDIKAFEINDANDSLLYIDGMWRCATCGEVFPAITKYEIDRYKWCPYCGRKFS